MSELQELMQNAIPRARGVLRDNYSNLLQVADYCESNYAQAQDKRKALEKTMDFTTQSLASVAYQISSLASGILQMLDLQANEVRQVEASVCSIAQVGKEPVREESRKGVEGVLGVSSSSSVGQCLKATFQLVDPMIDLEAPSRSLVLAFCALTTCGGGRSRGLAARLPPLVSHRFSSASRPDQSTQLAKTGTLSRRGTKTPATQSSGSPGRSYRIPEPIWPPVIPDGKLSSASSLSSLSSLTETPGSTSASAAAEPPPPPPPPPPLPSMLSSLPPPIEAENLPPPPADILPPPPVAIDDIPPVQPLEPALDFPASPLLPPLDVTHTEMLKPPLLPPPPPPEKLPWAPDTYLEEVVTIYPYTQQKEDELSFMEGTVIYVTRKFSNGWYEGVTHDAVGLFPGNYAEPLH
ncbi:ABI gene family member 3 [Varanus komodoensis]|uniref:ABI gene family member 3 n=1 Tax=Varanus komodoensis TaxID=61221 RepID=UPI001CF78178|nr:ABI gene family member 3 [Varanus komodoensis]